MPIKLFIENTEPHRAILVMSKGDVLECKVSGGSYNFNEHTFEGYLKITNVTYEMSPLSVQEIIKQIDFNSSEHAEETMQKVERIVPDLKEEHLSFDDVVGDGSQKHTSIEVVEDSDLKIGVNNVGNMTTILSEQEKLKNELNGSTKQSGEPKKKEGTIKPPPKVDANKSIKSQGKEKPKVTQVIKNLSDLPGAMKKAKLAKKQEKHQSSGSYMGRNDDKVKVEPPKQKDEISAWSGCIIIETDDFFERGIVLVHTYMNQEKVQEAVLLNSVKLDNAPAPLPLVFKKESVAKYFIESILKHPRWEKNAMMFKIHPYDYLDRDFVEDKSLLVKDPKTFVNDMSSRL